VAVNDHGKPEISTGGLGLYLPLAFNPYLGWSLSPSGTPERLGSSMNCIAVWGRFFLISQVTIVGYNDFHAGQWNFNKRWNLPIM